jgi:hypothetical protein
MLAVRREGVVRRRNCGSNKWLTKLSGKPTTRYRSLGKTGNEEPGDPSFHTTLGQGVASACEM